MEPSTDPDGRVRRLALGRAFESAMGDPWGEGPFGFPAARIRDETEREASAELRDLLATGFVRWTVPASAGGEAVDVDETFLLARLLSRRDQSLAVTAMATTVGYLPVWVGGTDAQRADLGARVLAGDRVGFALSERTHGSDVLANETVATRVPGGWSVDGSKEGIGNAEHARFFTCVARTGSRPGPGSMSILLVDRERAGAADAVRDARTWRMTGLRGFALGDVAFHDARVPDDGLVAPEGHGLETLLRSGQVARALITALPLGGTDTSLRLALDFARRRRIFGGRVSDAPYTRRQLAECFARLILTESGNTAAIRGIQAFPGQAVVLSSAVKYAIPRQLTVIQDTLTDVIGARHFDREHPRFSPHAKAVRDGRVAHFADGNAVVVLKAVAAALDRVLPGDHAITAAGDPPADPSADPRDDLARVADLSATLPGFHPQHQTIAAQGPDVATAALAGAARRLAALAADPAEGDAAEGDAASADAGPALSALARRASDDLARIWERGRAARARHARALAAEGPRYLASAGPLRTAELGCGIVMAGCACAAWSGNPTALGTARETLAVLALGLALDAGTADDVDPGVVELVARVAERLHDEGRLFSYLPVELAPEAEEPSWA
ncbi:acyl-CoA dehydrogenase family protein [Clavibacter sp. VKM Ac-2873]|uniref:acyl-CoA dehydrogenase family protein n=1 Tax=Clavibacter sp. VKM Ac-2873 TaxID=2783813 RepID=UPI001889D977|nr:acyl-CoA dehydrogenase family protein [Clavibacter sp. VKM Ac-2873]MBF4618627.1 acyl-CoA dehydrogenase family protein [Clavibacter sp. VKM Ac-2873]